MSGNDRQRRLRGSASMPHPHTQRSAAHTARKRKSGTEQLPRQRCAQLVGTTRVQRREMVGAVTR